MTRNPFAEHANPPRYDPAKHKLDPDQQPSGFVPGPAWEARRQTSLTVTQIARAIAQMSGGDEHRLGDILDAVTNAARDELRRDTAKDARGAGL